ncbi:hypothetical protein AVEN_30795-1 [Araneus ventricosus]|uniref:Uncharacterized protein n=1 Tax=Araneus ventricosus TaxID=182803 RepID=A0A4Y2MU40_ARAVE|nr:hypothetical protein AVEN_30795-1 [Araneus ventricosus]
MSTGLFVSCILENFEHPALRDWDTAYLPLQYFKSTNEEPVYRLSSKSPSMSTGQFVTYILETLAHPVLRTWICAYLRLQYFKSANEEPVYQVLSALVQLFGSDARTNIHTYIR